MSEHPTVATLRLAFDGRPMTAVPGTSLLQAWVAAGLPLVENVGCMGQGVCGACRVLVMRAGERLAGAALACETPAQEGMQVSFIDHFPASRPHTYDLHALTDSWAALRPGGRSAKRRSDGNSGASSAHSASVRSLENAGGRALGGRGWPVNIRLSF